MKVQGFFKDVGGASRVTEMRRQMIGSASAKPDPRDPTELDEEEEIRVYEPKGKQGIPILTEDPDPELAPITVKKKKQTP